MKSRITIEVDFDNGNLPVIKIVSRESDDVRDKLLRSFLQQLNHKSRWCVIQYEGYDTVHEEGAIKYTNNWTLRPIPPESFLEEIKLMKTEIELSREFLEKSSKQNKD
jgi:hypothetical protein